jgi:hypothetical protein
MLRTPRSRIVSLATTNCSTNPRDLADPRQQGCHADHRDAPYGRRSDVASSLSGRSRSAPSSSEVPDAMRPMSTALRKSCRWWGRSGHRAAASVSRRYGAAEATCELRSSTASSLSPLTIRVQSFAASRYAIWSPAVMTFARSSAIVAGVAAVTTSCTPPGFNSPESDRRSSYGWPASGPDSKPAKTAECAVPDTAEPATEIAWPPPPTTER